MTNNFKPRTNGYTPVRVSREEYVANKKAEKEAVYKMIDETAMEIARDPGKFKDFLDTQTRIDRYSTANALLIYKQCPMATRLKEFEDWGKDKISINKGAKSLLILEPTEYTRNDGSIGIAYNVKKVFDISQTNGKRQSMPIVKNDPVKLVALMLDSAPVNIESIDAMPSENMVAYYDNEKQTIFVKRNVQDDITLCQGVAQELAHAHIALDSEQYSRREAAANAVCAAYMFCRKNGVDIVNFPIDKVPEIIKDKDVKEIRADLRTMRNAFVEINRNVSEELHRQAQQRSMEQER